jgi:hypothetical protein
MWPREQLNLLCAAQAAAVLAGLAVIAPIIGMGIAGWSIWAGAASWRGAACR